MPSIVGEPSEQNERPRLGLPYLEPALRRFATDSLLTPWLAFLACSVFWAAGFGCHSQESSKDHRLVLTIAAAASLRPVLEAFAAHFEEQQPNVDVVLVYGATGTLVSQAEAGAPFDLVLAADEGSTQSLIESGRGESSTRFVFARGRWGLWVSKSCPIHPESQELRGLRSDRWRRIAWADPRVAPYGKVAEEILAEEKLLEPLKTRALVGSSVSQVAQWLDSEAADVGFIPLALALEEPLASKGTFLELTDRSATPIFHTGVMLRRTRVPEMVRLWIAELRGEHGRRMLLDHGYQEPDS